MKSESKFAPTSIDQHVGARIAMRRNMLGMTQKPLADECGITFQQMQKYEKAINRISVSRLFQIGMALDSPVAFFFTGLPLQPVDNTMFKSGATSDQKSIHRISEPTESDPMARMETLELITLYWKLSPEAREHIIGLIKTMLPANIIKEPESEHEFHSVF
ncbi:MAG: helix-turn-helix domain-containing protein [Alphaproteobacteria bacterium]|nr:helix-turn-helix domain-containing protein [Alphaproteobacteria bacterium]